MKANQPFLKFLEVFAQALILVVNQASWFWGWAGLWLWPILIFVFINRKEIGGLVNGVKIFTPIFVTHSVLFLLAPYSQARYAMSTILIGFLALLMLLYDKLMKGVVNRTRYDI